jgi:chromosome segregation ATPase
LRAGAEAKVSIEDNGIAVGAGSKYNAGNAEGGAAAVAGANYDGSLYAEAVSTSSAYVRLTRDEVEKAKTDLQHFRMERDKANIVLMAKDEAFEKQRNQVLQLQRKHDETLVQKAKAGKDKTDVLCKKTDVEMNLSALKMKLAADTRRVQSSTTKGGEHIEVLQRRVTDLTVEIARLEKEVDELDIIFKEYKTAVDTAERHLIDLGSKIVEETRILDKAKTEKDDAENKKKEAETRVTKEEANVKTHEDAMEEAESKLKDAKKDQDLYRNLKR